MIDSIAVDVEEVVQPEVARIVEAQVPVVVVVVDMEVVVAVVSIEAERVDSVVVAVDVISEEDAVEI